MEANPGPIDGSVLYDQDKHVSAAVWEGQERGALRCHEHTSKLGEWKLTSDQIGLVDKAGFGFLRKIPAISLDNPLISALVERWRRETNTFHFTVGEMTVTLQDVALLLGLAIDGKPVIGLTYTTCSSVCERLLGRAPDSKYASGGMVKLSWLKEFFSNCPVDAPTEVVEQCTRAYLLYLVGSTIFSTTTGNKVPVMYLPLFENFEEAGNYAWGAAALAFLYRALGNACVKSQSTICGCLTLLQCWSYFHLNIGCPKLNREPIHDHFPFVLKWKGKQSGPTTNRDVVFYRKALDSLKPIDVVWLPYTGLDGSQIPPHIKRTLVLGRSKTTLICFDKAERHLPDRCLRQYGMLQPIPGDVVRWVRKSRGVDGGVDLSGKMESELNEWSDRQRNILNIEDGVDEVEYMQWYSRITRRVVGRPISLSSEFQRTISGLREIAYLADSFSTKGLDGQQFESITRIRFIAQDCLRDQVGSPITPSPPPQLELGKRSRGKERVRRKGSLKRRRKDDPMENYEGSEDDQSHFYDATIEVDQLQLRQAQDAVGEFQLPQADDEVDPRQLCLTPDEENTAELHVVENKADDVHLSNTADDLDNSQPYSVTNDMVENPLFCNAAMEADIYSDVHEPNNEVSESELCRAKTDEVHDSKPCDSTNEVNDQNLHVATINEVKEANDSQLADPLEEAKDSQLSDSVNEEKNSQLCDATIVNKDSQHLDAYEQVTVLQLPDATLEGDFSQLLTKEGIGSQIPDAYNEVEGSQLYDSTEELKDSQLPDAAKEVEGSQLSVLTEELKESQLPNATEDAEGSQLSDSIEELKDSQLQEAAEKGEESQFLSATKEGKDMQISDGNEESDLGLQNPAEEGKDSELSDTIEKGVPQPPNSTGEANDVEIPDATDGANDSNLSHSADDSYSVAKAAFE
ncbi:protein MAIN-LIKE 2 [Mercurialis annua]|uniref:protein MAIN-LIKE 2 n=1 Tax=Mercurialis annua TaxID=3986 RepID=UPI00215FE860|nr:protein MAIN-LIKE 2 [Mercurialis annua]